MENLKKNPEIAYQQNSADSEDDTQTNILLLGLGGAAVLIILVGMIVIKIRGIKKENKNENSFWKPKNVAHDNTVLIKNNEYDQVGEIHYAYDETPEDNVEALYDTAAPWDQVSGTNSAETEHNITPKNDHIYLAPTP